MIYNTNNIYSLDFSGVDPGLWTLIQPVRLIYIVDYTLEFILDGVEHYISDIHLTHVYDGLLLPRNQIWEVVVAEVGVKVVKEGSQCEEEDDPHEAILQLATSIPTRRKHNLVLKVHGIVTLVASIREILDIYPLGAAPILLGNLEEAVEAVTPSIHFWAVYRIEALKNFYDLFLVVDQLEQGNVD